MSTVERLEGKVRHRDPAASWNAAKINPADWSELQAAIVDLLRELGPLTDDALYREYLARAYPRRSPQRIRTARKELTLVGVVRQSNVSGLSRLGNGSTKWEVR